MAEPLRGCPADAGGVLPSYRTLAKTGRSEIEIKKSVFIGLAAPVSAEADAADLMEQMRSRFSDARHQVYAWRIGRPGDQQLQRYSDDGEPRGTAGLPVLETLLRRELTEAAVIVVRYFGGILLGTGGLVRAYGEAAHRAVEAARPVLMTQQDVCRVTLPYAQLETFLHRAAQLDIVVLEQQYEAAVSLMVALPPETVPVLTELLAALTGGRARPHLMEKRYTPAPLDGSTPIERRARQPVRPAESMK